MRPRCGRSAVRAQKCGRGAAEARPRCGGGRQPARQRRRRSACGAARRTRCTLRRKVAQRGLACAGCTARTPARRELCSPLGLPYGLAAPGGGLGDGMRRGARGRGYLVRRERLPLLRVPKLLHAPLLALLPPLHRAHVRLRPARLPPPRRRRAGPLPTWRRAQRPHPRPSKLHVRPWHHRRQPLRGARKRARCCLQRTAAPST